MTMLQIDDLQLRLSSPPWALHRAVHLAGKQSRDDGFYVGMLKDDLQKQRYAYEISMVPLGVDWPRASDLLLALLNDFNHTGYSREPAAIICEFANGLLAEATERKDLILELHALPDDLNRSKSRRAKTAGSAEAQPTTLPSLGLVPSWSVRRIRSELSQVSPDAGLPPVIIPGPRIHRLCLRRANLSRWTQVIRELRQVDVTRVIGAGVDRLSWEGYSFPEVVATQNLAVAATTAPIGWGGRGTFSESVTSPYLTFRRLRFLRFWIETVEDSVAFLNQFTSSESLYGTDAFTFSLAGLPSTGDLTKAMLDIRNGSLTVEQAQNTYFFPKYAKHSSSTDNS